MVSNKMHICEHPINLVTEGWADFELIDSGLFEGQGCKLERYGPYLVIRPEPQCIWQRRFHDLWDRVDALFDPTSDDDDGRWRLNKAIPEQWTMHWDSLKFAGRLTNFRHLAFFPEQAANWQWQKHELTSLNSPRVLNLFGYTGLASLNAARLGAQVTHVDASKKAIGWARDNATLSGLHEAPIRWICEDARKYARREVKRGALYDAIILDPPKYGRGPTGEVWRLFEDLPEMLHLCAQLLSPTASFLLLNAYAARVSGPALAHSLSDALGHERGGTIDYGELTLCENATPSLKHTPSRIPAREFGLSFFARWRA